jgi:hypothetical protein
MADVIVDHPEVDVPSSLFEDGRQQHISSGVMSTPNQSSAFGASSMTPPTG